jgi:hypothetical protein
MMIREKFLTGEGVMPKGNNIHGKWGVFVEKARYYSDKFIMDRKIKRIRREKGYRRWLQNPRNRKGKPINLMTYKELRKMRNRFLYILWICFTITSIQTTFLYYTTADVIGGGIFLGVSLMGFAHIYMAASVDWSIYRRWGNKKSFLDWD